MEWAPPLSWFTNWTFIPGEPTMTSAGHGIQSTPLIILGWHLDLHQYSVPVG